MVHETIHAPPARSRDSAAGFVERVRMVQSNTLSTTFFQIIIYPVFLYVLWGKCSGLQLGSWSLLFALAMGYRTLTAVQCGRTKLTEATAPVWSRRLLVGAAAVAFTWGVAAVMLEAYASEEYRGFTAFILGGMAVTGISVSSPVLPIFRAFLLSLLTPLVAYNLVKPTSENLLLGGMTLVFFMVLLIVSMRYNRFMKKSLALRYDNTRMLEEFTLANRILSESQKRFEDIASITGEWIWEINADNKYTYVSDKVLDILGYEPKEIIGKSPFDLMPAKEAARVREVIDKQSENSDAIQNVENWNLTKTGGLVCLLTNGLCLRDKNGKVTGYRGVDRDITHRKRDERNKEMVEIGLRQVQKMQATGQLAAGIAHEINTPVQFVSDNTKFLKDAVRELSAAARGCEELTKAAQKGEISEEMVKYYADLCEDICLDELNEDLALALDKSTEGLDRIGRTVNAIREFSGPSTGETAKTDLKSAIISSIDVSRHEWKLLADIHTDFDETLLDVPIVSGDFNQVILNLIINAAHAIEENHDPSRGEKGSITIRTKHNNDWAEISISDNGVGIDRELQTRIFDPFFTTKDVGKGSGQGLSHAWSIIVDKHKGAINVRSSRGKGSTFTILVPMQAQPITV
jgi:two-component system, NtrC family, sensor kinase